MNPLLEYDENLRNKHHALIMGIDEAGRGSWAGPLCAGACILPDGVDIPGLNDSKKLTHEQREKLAIEIKKIAIAWSVDYVYPSEIDEHGLTWANGMAMKDAAMEAQFSIWSADTLPKILYVLDQFGQREWSAANLLQPYVMSPKMDGTSLSCAAASVLCKTERDQYMTELHQKHPEYGFADHKGYVNTTHIAAVKKYGLLREHHRASYQVTGVNKPRQITLLDME